MVVCTLYSHFCGICVIITDFLKFFKSDLGLYFKFDWLLLLSAYSKTNCNISGSCKKCVCNWPPPTLRPAGPVAQYPIIMNCSLWTPPCMSVSGCAYLTCFLILSWYLFKEVLGYLYVTNGLWYSWASDLQFPVLIDIRLVIINRHARCSL